ncbi:MAG TPA: oligosaccharide flippase family protein [Verrucomicrobiae bacterium]|nr:oligosaccharide flippase family protein [Verrucomicrobiae bacterium]
MSSRLIAVGCYQIVFLASGLVGIRLLTHLVPEEVFGAYQVYFITLTTLGLLVTHPGIINYASRYWQRERARGDQFARFLWRTSMAQAWPLAALLAVVTVALAAWKHTPGTWLLFPLAWLSALITALASIANLVLNAGERHWAIFALGGLGAAARALLPFAMAVWWGPTLEALEAGYAIQSVLVLGLILVLFRRAAQGPAPAPEVRDAWLAELRTYGRPFIILGVGGWLLQYADRWVISWFIEEKQLGLFVLASVLSSYVPNLVQTTLMQLLFPRIFRQSDHATTLEEWRSIAGQCDRASWMYLSLSCAGLVALWAGGNLLVGRLIHIKYGPAMALVIPAGMATLTGLANQFQFLLLQGRRNSADMVRVTLILAAVKTTGSVIAAAISWSCFLGWLVVSLPVSVVLGRMLIHRAAFQAEPRVATS